MSVRRSSEKKRKSTELFSFVSATDNNITTDEAQQGRPAGLFLCGIWRRISIDLSPTSYWMHPPFRLLCGLVLIFLPVVPEDLPKRVHGRKSDGISDLHEHTPPFPRLLT